MITKKQAAAELLRRRKARKSLAAYIEFTNLRYKTSAFSAAVCSAIDKFIDDMQAGKRPVLVFQAPPQHGKTEIVSRKLTAYLMGRFPDMHIGGASYSDELASAIAQEVRRNIASSEHAILFPAKEEKRRYDVNRTGEFTSPGGRGGYIGVGVGSGLTGRPLDCFVAGTMVQTDRGLICIEDLHIHSDTLKILTYNGERLEYGRLKAFASSKGFGIYRVTTANGRVFEATGDHRVFTGRGYIEANKLSQGDRLVCCVRESIDKDGGRGDEIISPRNEGHVLLSSMHPYNDDESSSENLEMLRGVREEIQGMEAEILQPRMQAFQAALQASSAKENLRNVHDGILGQVHFRRVSDVLQQALREQGSCQKDDGGGESALPGRSQPFERAAAFCESLSNDSPLYPGEGRESVRAVRRRPSQNRGTSHRWMGEQQCIIEFDHSMREMSQRDPQSDGFTEESDYVSMVERVREEATVYDIQIEGNSNFFANGVLVHNCGIIDDPVKNQKEALSPTTKESHWNWYQSVFTTRLSEHSGQIVMATSWAEDDLPARICKHFSGNPRLTILRFPAINLPGETGYNPQLPEGALVPGLHSLEKLRETQSLLSDYWWSALYQQSPKSLGGNVFKESGIQHYLPKDLPQKFDKVIMSWDMTFKDSQGTDFVVGQVWGKVGSNSYLLEQVRERMGFTATKDALSAQAKRWPVARRKLVEDKANGPAVIDSLKSTVSGLIPVEPDGSKVARAHAVTAEWEAGNIWLPHPDIAPWIKDFVSELTAFPASANDDQVDAMTQALRDLYSNSGAFYA